MREETFENYLSVSDIYCSHLTDLTKSSFIQGFKWLKFLTFTTCRSLDPFCGWTLGIEPHLYASFKHLHVNVKATITRYK